MENSEIEAALERGGFRSDVAGADFARIVRGAAKASASGKGLLLSGRTGRGKTLAMRCLFPATLPPKRDCRWVDCYDSAQVNWLGDRDILVWASTLVLDDIGAERIVSDYGVMREPVADFFMALSRRRDSGMGAPRICATTNLDSAAMAARYGDRMLSRLLDVVVPVVLAGEDKRGAAL